MIWYYVNTYIHTHIPTYATHTNPDTQNQSRHLPGSIQNQTADDSKNRQLESVNRALESLDLAVQDTRKILYYDHRPEKRDLQQMVFRAFGPPMERYFACVRVLYCDHRHERRDPQQMVLRSFGPHMES
jgi:hypothetical protein